MYMRYPRAIRPIMSLQGIMKTSEKYVLSLTLRPSRHISSMTMFKTLHYNKEIAGTGESIYTHMYSSALFIGIY